MRNLINYAMILAAIALLVAGCQNGSTPVQPESRTVQSLGLFSLPDGAIFESATFNIAVVTANDRTVDIHRVTAPWEEMVVTWNNFGSSFDGNVEGSFVNSGPVNQYHSVDVTALVAGWLNGTYPNYGLLMDQVDFNFPRGIYYSREAWNYHPYLEICYLLDGDQVCDQIEPDADTYIYERWPDFNDGAYSVIYTGWQNDTDYEKQSLLYFDIEAAPELAAIGDFVWIDENRDGIQDDGEPGFPDVTVNLYDCDDNFIATTQTDANGYYLFDGLTPGDYYVEFIQPEGYDITLQDQGSDDALDSDADITTGLTICTTLEPGETDLTWDCGLYLMEMEGCSLTIGFWKTHAGFGPQADVVTPLLPIWLGTSGGTHSINVNSAQIAHDLLTQHVYGEPSNGITKLYAQMLGTKLNIANGADGSAVGNIIALADAFLAAHDYTDWDGLSKADKKLINGWKSIFDDYNNGDIGPGHCD